MAVTAKSPSSNPANHDYLALLGGRVRQVRAQRGMSRRILAAASGVSERYLAQLEAGKGNASVLVLKAIADALHLSLDDLVDSHPSSSPDYRWLRARLRDASMTELAQLATTLKADGGAAERTHLALVGLRGAGKSTLGQALAKQLGVPFVELVQEIERLAGSAVSEILATGGQSAYRQHEREALSATLARFDCAVIAVGGSLVSEAQTYDLLLSTCCCVWLQASPVEHMERVIAQGDLRPMADNRHAMADLKRMLEERRALYERADHCVDTSGQTVADTLAALSGLRQVQLLAERANRN